MVDDFCKWLCHFEMRTPWECSKGLSFGSAYADSQICAGWRKHSPLNCHLKAGL